MALTLLLIMFIVMAVISGLGIALLYLVKNNKAKNIIFYFLAIWAMLIAFINATSLPSNYLLQQIIAWSFGFLSIIGIIINIVKKDKVNLSYLFITASVLLGLADLFFF